MNDYFIENDIAFIILRDRYKNKKGVVIIDADDVDVCIVYNWYLDSLGYARASISGKKVRLHKFITNTDNKSVVDHINRNRLDCSKSNLRVCSYSTKLYRFVQIFQEKRRRSESKIIMGGTIQCVK